MVADLIIIFCIYILTYYYYLLIDLCLIIIIILLYLLLSPRICGLNPKKKKKDLQQVHDITSTYYTNMTIPTSKIHSNLRKFIQDDRMTNKYFLDHMTFPTSRLSGQTGASQILDNSTPSTKIHSINYSQVTNKPTTTTNNKTSTMTVDSSIDLLDVYKIINSLNPTNAQDLVILNYSINYIVPWSKLSGVPSYFNTKTSIMISDNNLDFNNYKVSFLVEAS